MFVDVPPAVVQTLPIFRLDGPSCCLYYTPGYLVAVEISRIESFEADLYSGRSNHPLAIELQRHAVVASKKNAEQLKQPFEPLCLTLYLNNACNLNCEYCYSDPAAPDKNNIHLSLENIRAAAEVVAANCAAQGRIITVVFHGGGEPTLSKPQMQAALETVERVAACYNLKTFKYIATNGVMSASKAAWLADHFDLVGLSCDGPIKIQSRQRPLRNGRDSLVHVERTAQILREREKSFQVRATLTSRSFEQQVEIAKYICTILRPLEINVEPVYQGGRTSEMDGFSLERADAFVDEFFKARRVAHSYGVAWSFSGSRLGEIHGPYCHIFRNVLNLVPAGLATACFKRVEVRQIHQLGLAIGQRDAVSGQFVLDQQYIQTLRQKLSIVPIRCQACINRFHCVRGCPDQCPVELATNDQLTHFRCRVLRLMLEKQLWEFAANLDILNEAGISGKALAVRQG